MALSKYALLVRAINVGGHSQVSMQDLRRVLCDLGLDDVATLLQSGNAVFTAPDRPADALAADIEQALQTALGVSLRCLVKTAGEVAAVIRDNPLAEVATQPSHLFAFFLLDALDPALLASYDPVSLDPENIRMGERVIYQWCPAGLMAAPRAAPLVERRLKVLLTARNWNTVTKLGVLLAG